MDNNNQSLRDGFELWQRYAEAYSDFVLGATQRAVAQSLAVREQFDSIFADSLKRAQDLNTREQELAFGALELFQAQAKSAAERFARILNTNSQS